MSLDPGRESLEAPSTPKASTVSTLTPQRTVADAPPAQDIEMRSRMDRVLQSDIGINTLLTRLKQSVSSAREFSGFLRDRASLEEKHAHGMQRLTRGTQDLLGRPDNRQGSFAFNYREMGVIHERMAKNSEDFAHNLLAMSDELQDLSAHCERARKQWKHTGLEAEQRAQDADSAMEKAKQRYFSLAEQYDRVRTGESQGGKFGLKGPKSARQQEESLLSKAENADQEYRSRVEAAQAQRHELMTSSRPQAIRELQNAIMECDAAVSMQLQKFAVLNEKLLLGNGLCVSPLKTQENGAAQGSRSLREVAQSINNHKDFEDFVLSHNSKVGPAPGETRYEKHPALAPTHHQPPPPSNMFNPPTRTDTGFGSMSGPMNQGGQTSGIVANQPPFQQGPHHAPQSSTAMTAPQLPQIGSMSTGPRRSLEGGRFEPAQGRGENDYRNFSGPPQHLSGQPSHLDRTNGATSPTAHSLVTNYQAAMGAGLGRGQPPVTSGPPSGPSLQGPFPLGQRGPSLGQPTDFRPDARGPSQGPGYQAQLPETRGPQGPGYQAPQPEARATPSGPLYPGQKSDIRGPQQGPGYQTQQTDIRGPQQGPGYQSDNRTRQQGAGYQTNQADGRGPQQGAGFQTIQPDARGSQPGPGYQVQQPDARGLPSQSAKFGPTATGAPSNNTSSIGGPLSGGRGPPTRSNLVPLRPVFGVSLDELFRRDGAAVPAIVYQCVQAVELFGLKTEGVYRISGSAQHIMELQALFDHDASQIDFRSPAAFYNDIASVTTLLKHFLRDLPDPLLTSAQYSSFIQAAKIEEDIVRRDSLHAIINSLPDPNYATLRTLTLHLNRVAQNSPQNKMTARNLAIVFGPTLMGGNGGGLDGEIQDSGWQARVVETILHNTLQIFDDDD